MGHVLHESAAFTAARESQICGEFTTINDKVFCKPEKYNGGPSSPVPYCAPNGCGCEATLPESVESQGSIEAEKMFFGRGAIQLSWSYNYKDFQDKGILPPGVNICITPELLATNEEYVWTSAFYFWTLNKGQENIKTCQVAVVGEGDWGSALRVINGALECNEDADKGPLQQRLNYYCLAATTLKAKPLLKLDGCEGLKAVYDACLQYGKCCSFVQS